MCKACQIDNRFAYRNYNCFRNVNRVGTINQLLISHHAHRSYITLPPCAQRADCLPRGSPLMKKIDLSTSMCIYCGKQFSTRSGDHTFPRGLLAPKTQCRNPQMIQVPSCSQCQGTWADDEEHFIRAMAASAETTHPEAQIVREQIALNIENHNSYASWIRSWEYIPNPTCDDDGSFHTRPAKGSLVPTMSKIARGLYWFHFHVALPILCDVGVDFLSSLVEAERYSHHMEAPVDTFQHSLLCGTVKYSCSNRAPGAVESSWLIEVYGGIYIYLRTTARRQAGDVLVGVDGDQIKNYIVVSRSDCEVRLREAVGSYIHAAPRFTERIVPPSAVALFDVVDRPDL